MPSSGLLVIALSAVVAATAGPAGATMHVDTVVAQRVDGVAVPFVRDSGSRFRAATFAGTTFVTGDGKLVHALAAPRARRSHNGSATRSVDAIAGDASATAGKGSRPLGWTLVESFSRFALQPRGDSPSPTGVTRIASGNGEASDETGYDTVALGAIAEGIEMSVRAHARNVEKIFTVQPHADPSSIRAHVDGALSMRLDAGGELVVETGNGEVAFSAPVAFQPRNGRTMPVDVHYVVDRDAHDYGFAVGHYDADLPLVIDPLLQSTYLGGSLDDQVLAIAVDPASGDLLATGTTTSITGFPGVSGGFQSGNAGGGGDAFVARFDPTLTILRQATYYGAASSFESVGAIAIAANGEVIIGGHTSSTGLPGTQGAVATINSGGTDVFLARFASSLTSLVRTTYYGGTGNETLAGLVIDPVSGDIVVGGCTTSSTLLGTTGAAQSANSRNPPVTNGFVARLKGDLTAMVRATFLGAENFACVQSVTINPANNEIVVGGSAGGIIVIPSQGSAQNNFQGGNSDGFVARFNGSLTSMPASVLVGGSGDDVVQTIAIHPISGEIYAAGLTKSTNFPAVNSGVQNMLGTAGGNGFIIRITPNLTAFSGATYYGGFSRGSFSKIVVDPKSGQVIAAGLDSSGSIIGTSGGVQPGSNSPGMDEVMVARFDRELSSVLQATFLGTSAAEQWGGMALSSVDGTLYLGGATPSSSFPGTTGGAQPAHASDGGRQDGFIARLTEDLSAADTTPDPLPAFLSQNRVPTASVRTSNPIAVQGLGSATTIYVEGQAGSAYCVSSAANCSCDLSGSAFVSTPGTLSAGNKFVCVRHVSASVADVLTQTRLHIGPSASTFNVSTGTLIGSGCSLDVDGNAAIDALSDGVIILRAMFGLVGTAVTNGAVAGNATRTTWTQIQTFLNNNCGTSFQP